MKMSGKITGFCLLGVAALAAAVGLSLVGCSEDSRSCWSPFPREVEATLPSLAVAEAVVVEPMGSRAACANDRVSEGADGLSVVALDEIVHLGQHHRQAGHFFRTDLAGEHIGELEGLVFSYFDLIHDKYLCFVSDLLYIGVR